jgi:hypothetical protein
MPRLRPLHRRFDPSPNLQHRCRGVHRRLVNINGY